MLDNGGKGSKTSTGTLWGDPVLISTGHVSPFSVEVPDDDCVATLCAGSDTPALVVAVDRPSLIDLMVLGQGSIDIALTHERTVAFLIWRFMSSGHSVTLEAPLHIGLEASTEFLGISAERHPAESQLLIIVVQDEKGIVQRIRSVSMPTLILERLAPLIRRQIAERDRHDLQRDYDRAIERFNRRYSDPDRAFAAATIKASVA